MFPSIGSAELIIFLLIILLLFGAKRIPELARSLGSGLTQFKKGLTEDAHEEEIGPSNLTSEELPEKQKTAPENSIPV